MSLMIGLAVEGTQPLELDADTVVAMEDDGYYWFLYPLLETLAECTGEMIDPYGGATFAGRDLDSLHGTLVEARRRIEPMPERWNVQTGMSLGSNLHPTPPTPLNSEVEKEAFVALIERLDAVVAKAKTDNRRIVCLGD